MEESIEMEGDVKSLGQEEIVSGDKLLETVPFIVNPMQKNEGEAQVKHCLVIALICQKL